MELRWYQKQAVSAVWDYLREKDGAPCVVLPTGSGKTPVIAELCRQVVEWKGRALVLAHVKELLQQSVDKLGKFLDPSLVGCYSAGLNERTTSTPVVVAGIQSVYQRAEELGEFHLIIVDEAHLIPPVGTGRYRQFLEAEKTVSPKARLVGLTATPYRTGCGWITRDRATDDESETGYDRLLDEIVYEVPTDQLIADGTLSGVSSRAAFKAPDFSRVKTTRGDFDETEIERVWNGKNVLDAACSEIVEKTQDRKKVVVFCNRVESARRCAKLLEQFDPANEAAVVDGETSATDRAELVKRFKGEQANLLENGKPLKYVCNVGVFTTGFDAPNVDCVALLRPTKSLTLYQQMVGRGLRRAPDKYDCLVLDFGGNIDRHGPIDLPRPEGDLSDANKPWKICRFCGGVVAKLFTVCPLCGKDFKVERGESDPNAGLSTQSSLAAILSNDPFQHNDEDPIVDETDVMEVEYSAHYKKDSDKPPTLQVKYIRSHFRRPAFEWLCPEHESRWARRRFESWWKSKSKVDPPTDTETAALWASKGALATPKRIRTTLEPGERFPKIEWLEFSEIPDFDPRSIKDDTDEFLVDFEQYAPPTEETGDYIPPEQRPRCKECDCWNDYVTENLDGFCRKFNTETNGDEPACDGGFEPRWIDPNIPF